jgi:hypothetical protein
MTELDTPLFIPPVDEGLIGDRKDDVAMAQLLHSPPRKRPRNVLERAEDIAKLPQRQALEIVRDEDYYLSDGSCIILVENTLFNVSTLFEHQIQWYYFISCRCTEPLYRKIPLLLVLCFPYPKEANLLKANQMIIQSFSSGTRYHGSGISYGPCMLCELQRLSVFCG